MFCEMKLHWTLDQHGGGEDDSVSPHVCRTCFRNIMFKFSSVSQWSSDSCLNINRFTANRKCWRIILQSFNGVLRFYLFIQVICSVLNQVPSCFSCLAERCNSVLLWSSRNVLWTTTLRLTLCHQWMCAVMLFSGQTENGSISFFLLRAEQSQKGWNDLFILFKESYLMLMNLSAKHLSREYFV